MQSQNMIHNPTAALSAIATITASHPEQDAMAGFPLKRKINHPNCLKSLLAGRF